MRKALLFLLLLAACAPKPAEKPAAQAGEAPALAVRTLVAEEGVLEREGRAQARLEPARESRVAAGVSGRVVLAREAGSRVAQGEAVVVLDEKPFQDALEAARLALAQAQANLEKAERQSRETRPALEAQLASAQANLEGARRRYQEAQALYEAGAVARLDLLALEAQLRQAEAAYQNALEALNRLDRGEDLRLLRLQVEQARLQVNQAERNLKEARIRAPFAGEVVEVYVRPGEFAAAGQPAFRLGSLDLLAKAYLPPEEVEALGQARLLLRQGGKEAEARLLRKGDLPGQNRLVEVVLTPSAPLLPGAAELVYRIPLAQGILLPAGAVRVQEGEAFVFVVEEGQARKRPVRILAQSGERVAVAGLRPKERVVYPVPESLSEGDRVEAL
jgi:multidrug efflux pump subunit AcrA (membrane-fusion protein)